VNKYAYTPFGGIANQQEAVAQPFKFVGQYGVMAEPNGLYYMRARYYDPSVGRFISEDPSGFGGGDVNLYAYCGNNPVLLIDPEGLWGVFGGISFRVTAPGASVEAGGRLLVGTEGDGIRACLSGNVSGTMLGGGAAAGRGLEGGFFTHDVSDFMNSSSINVDSPIGGVSISFNSNGLFEGIAFGGPSKGFGLSYSDPKSSQGLSGSVDIVNTNTSGRHNGK
jgi:RHS repeat-associated protein